MLVAVDIDDPTNTERELARALFLASDLGRIRLINVRPARSFRYDVYLPDSFDTEELARHDAELYAWAQKSGLPPERISTVVRTGSVAGEVLAEAMEWKADLIIVGSHHPTTLTRLLGSNAERIVREATVSVLVARD
ncbi:universal stress protein UspA [Caulobacter mirabilis]|uniref:Universal stress protein UspA n=1 Tax=Caulobacter mirabilis TaxID=69666 RepID=A0A2D2B3U7_9CAUL|nr:universal stress protein UspA [Caulobacter mirabilis]